MLQWFTNWQKYSWEASPKISFIRASVRQPLFGLPSQLSRLPSTLLKAALDSNLAVLPEKSLSFLDTASAIWARQLDTLGTCLTRIVIPRKAAIYWAAFKTSEAGLSFLTYPLSHQCMTAMLSMLTTRFLPATACRKAIMGRSRTTLSSMVDLLP